MRKIFIISLITIFFWFNSIYAQTDNLARAVITNAELTSNNSIEFDLKLIRTSDKWEYFANGTFQIEFDSLGYTITPQIHTIEYLRGTSDLDLSPLTGQLPKVNYYMTPRIFTGRISITIAGPDNYNNCKIVPLDTNGITIGRFRVTTLNGSIPPKRFKWLQPYDYYQACSYKLDKEVFLMPGVTKYFIDDNVDMNDRSMTGVSYEIMNVPEPRMIVKNFRAIYKGLKKVELTWETESEAYNKGFIIARTVRAFGDDDPSLLSYPDTVADYRIGINPHDSCIGLGTSKTGKKYRFLHDSIPFRGLDYCYELMYQDFYGKIHGKIDFACLKIPNSVIVFAQADPNPMSSHTKITYKLEDDANVTCKVYDLNGKLVDILLDYQTVKMGVWELDFIASPLAQQGLYDVVIIAYPIDDPTVEISKAVIKVQLVR